VLSRKWVKIGNERALLRVEESCMADRSFIQVYLTKKKHVAEVTVWNADQTDITTADINTAIQVLQTFRFE
jgi:hypothetical protein